MMLYFLVSGIYFAICLVWFYKFFCYVNRNDFNVYVAVAIFFQGGLFLCIATACALYGLGILF